MTNIDQLEWEETIDLLCYSAAGQILEGISFTEFRARMEGMVGLLLKVGGVPKEAQQPEMQRCMATAVALEIWNATPIPKNRFRPRKQAKPERNSPCLCGSGKKFKQCCAAVDGPELGISEALMLVQVLMQFPRKQLASLPILDLHPESLAMVARRWLEDGQEKDAIALLENLFSHLPKLDARSEEAADTLLGCYLETNAPRKKQKFIDALKGAPDKALRSTGWQRQATVLSDKGNYPAAWEAFQEAQRLTPNEPALSHLEILLLVSEGRRDEAKARATFWSARLARDSKYDHSELIALLHNLAADDDDSLLRSLASVHDPLADLATLIKSWPAPACDYKLAHGVELEPTKKLADCEMHWMELRDGLMDPDRWLAFLLHEPQAGNSFRILRDSIEMLGMLPETLPGQNDVLVRRLLERSEALRCAVLGKLKALDKELPWGFLDNRPMLTLVSYYIDEFAATRPAETLDLLRWSVNIANPGDNIGLRESLIHTLIASGHAEEAITVAARYPNDMASTEYGRVLALFAAGRLDQAETALKNAAEKSPKVWKMLNAASPRKPASKNPGYFTVGGDDEAYTYRTHHLDLWRATGALKWGASIKLIKPKSKATEKSPPDSTAQTSLPGLD
jgi:tetratricopeptide (TPR) repeat protein